MKFLLSTSSFFLLLINLGTAQSYNQNYSTGKQEGYIILKDGSKVKGELKVRGKLRNQKEIYFYENSDLPQIFTPYTIDAYFFEGTKFKSTGSEFRQVIEEGCLNIYIYYYMNYSASVSSGLPIVIPYRTHKTEKKYRNEQITNLYNSSFRKDWSAMLSDNVEIASKILSREYKRKHVLLITQKYNETCKE